MSSSSGQLSFQDELSGMLKQFQSVPKPESLTRILTVLRHEMEVPANSTPSGFRTGHGTSANAIPLGNSSGGSNQRSFGQNAAAGGSGGGTVSSSVPAWRSGAASMKKVSSHETFQTIHKSNSNSSLASTNSSGKSPRTSFPAVGDSSPGGSTIAASASSSTTGGRYQSRFVSKGNIEDKILNTIIGNKLNAFTPLTYKDTRDFIYQIMDSGEVEFIKEFVEKVFMKATVEELYCALFAKLLAEIAHHYPVMYEEMNRYHTEFLRVFDDVQEGAADEESMKKRQYRMGYGQFISELASLHALPKEHLLTIVQKVSEAIDELTKKDDKVKVVEEYVDCLIRLTENLHENSRVFYASVQMDLQEKLLPVLAPLAQKKAGERPSLSSKARYRLMDLRDLLLV